jgi:hypothetical protein
MKPAAQQRAERRQTGRGAERSVDVPGRMFSSGPFSAASVAPDLAGMRWKASTKYGCHDNGRSCASLHIDSYEWFVTMRRGGTA